MGFADGNGGVGAWLEVRGRFCFLRLLAFRKAWCLEAVVVDVPYI